MSTVQAGARDASCCPGDLIDRPWTLSADRLKESDPVRTGRLSLATLARTVWTLQARDITEPAASDPALTLVYDAGRFGTMLFDARPAVVR